MYVGDALWGAISFGVRVRGCRILEAGCTFTGNAVLGSIGVAECLCVFHFRQGDLVIAR